MRIVEVRQQPSGLWILTDDQGERYATTSSWKAAIGQRAKELGQDVAILSARGWYYRSILSIAIVKDKEACA